MDRGSDYVRAPRAWLIVAVIVQITLLVGLLRSHGPFDYVAMDFLTTYVAAEMISDGAAADLYDLTRQWDYQRPIVSEYRIYWPDRFIHPYIAPPQLGVISLPFLLLTPAHAAIAWSALTTTCVAIGLWMLVQRLPVSGQAAAAIVVGSFPLYYVALLGQVEGFLFLAFVIFAIAIRSRDDRRAGLALSLLAIKPPLLLAPMIFLVVLRKGAALRAMLLGVALQAIGVLALLGRSGIQDYLELSRQLSAPSGTTATNVWGMVNIRAIVVRAFPADDPRLLNTVIIALTLATLAFSIRIWQSTETSAHRPSGLALLAFTMVLTSYHSLYHTTLFALLGVVFLVGEAEHSGNRLLVDRLIVLSWLSFTILPLLTFVVVQTSKVPAAIGTMALLLLWGVAAYLCNAPKRAPRLAYAHATDGDAGEHERSARSR